MHGIQGLSHWFVQNLLVGSAVLFGGAVLIVTLVTFWQDFSGLENRKRPSS